MFDHDLTKQQAGFPMASSRQDRIPVEAWERKERLLIDGLAGLAHRDSAGQIVGYCGWTLGTPPRALLHALGKALPFPSSLEAALAEWQQWHVLAEGRRGYDGQRLPHPVHIRARLAALATLFCNMPDPTIEGIQVRLAWLERVIATAFYNADEMMVLTESLRRDFKAFVRCRPFAGSDFDRGTVPRCNADKRKRVLRLLNEQPQLSDREIARRCRVTAPMVGKWRKRCR